MSRVPVVIDTNVVFKALRLKYSSLREVLNQGTYHFYAPKFLLVEIFKHKEKFAPLVVFSPPSIPMKLRCRPAVFFINLGKNIKAL